MIRKHKLRMTQSERQRTVKAIEPTLLFDIISRWSWDYFESQFSKTLAYLYINSKYTYYNNYELQVSSKSFRLITICSKLTHLSKTSFKIIGLAAVM